MSKAKEHADREEDLVVFRTRPLMGAWTLAHAGVVCDAYQCKAVGDDAISFCQRFSIAQPLRFSTKLYGTEGALTCCRFWCQKLSFLFRLWLDSRASEFPFPDDVLESWHEPPEFEELVRSVPAPAAQARFESLRALRPLRPA